MKYRLERSRYQGGEWGVVFAAPSPFPPGSAGYAGKKGERLRWRTGDAIVEIWEWADRIPINPGDVQCTDFAEGWRLVQRGSAPAPNTEELSHFFNQT